MKKCSMGNCPGIVVDRNASPGDAASEGAPVVVVGYPVRIEDRVIDGLVGLPVDYWRQFKEEYAGSTTGERQPQNLADRIINIATGDPDHDDYLVFGGTVIEHPQAGEGEVAVRLIALNES